MKDRGSGLERFKNSVLCTNFMKGNKLRLILTVSFFVENNALELS